jgi:ankyrin repeat protein
MSSINDQLFSAAVNTDKKIIRDLLKNKDIDFNYKNNVGETILMVLCIYDHEDIVEEIIHMDIPGIDYYIKDNDGDFLLLILCYYGKIDILNLLITKIDINKCINDSNLHGYTMLNAACLKNHTNIVKCLLKYSSLDINAKCINNEYSILHIACMKNNKEIVYELLQRQDIDINTIDSHNATPLIIMCFRDNDYIVNLLLNHKNINYTYAAIIDILGGKVDALTVSRRYNRNKIIVLLLHKMLQDLSFMIPVLSSDILRHIVEEYI